MRETALVAELYQAANLMERVPLAERKRLLEKAIVALGVLRERAHQIDDGLADVSDLMFEINALVTAIHAIDSVRLANTFLACAEVIRSLGIMIDTDGR